MESNPLIGAWRLVAYEGHTGDNVLHPLGEDATGYIMYTARRLHVGGDDGGWTDDLRGR